MMRLEKSGWEEGGMKMGLRSLMHYSIFITLITAIFSCNRKEEQSLKLWYDHPATIWEEALPLGNGKSGAMVFGGVYSERYQLNDNTLWSGGPRHGNQPDGPKVLKEVRDLIDKGDYGKAGETWKKMHGPYSARYLPLGDLWVNFEHEDSTVTDYYRDLDLNNAVSTVAYKIYDNQYRREAFISYPDKAMIIRYTSDQPDLNFTASLTSKLRYETDARGVNYLVLRGKAPQYVAHRDSEPEQVVYAERPEGEGMNFEIHLKILNVGGSVESSDSLLKVTGAKSVVLYLTEETSFNGFHKSPGYDGIDPGFKAISNLNKAVNKTYSDLKEDHIRDYRNLFNRVRFNLRTSGDMLNLPTDRRMLRFNEGSSDKHLMELYFQYGRYLMIAGSRPGSQAMNLQGLWNDHVQPPWGSNYTMNINTEMNYWPAEVANLSECHSPLFDFIQNLSITGSETARINYGIEEGWCAHHNSDIWAKTSPTGGEDWDPRGSPRWSCWPMAGGWLTRHLWEHFLYTGDTAFLRNTAWPLMKGSTQFMLAWLVEDENGNLVTNPSTSPENSFRLNGNTYDLSMASTMDMSIIRDLFHYSIETSKVLDTDAELRNELKNAYGKLYPFQIGQYGQLQEWFMDWDRPEDDHRHLSHLYGLHPSNLIIPERSPELAAAAVQSLNHRGDISTGWSMAWKINWWARLGDGDRAWKILKSGLEYIGPQKDVFGGGGTYPNLFDAHPPFQIDGNFGGTAGIIEMLMQSHAGYISLLPALPSEWSEGEIAGIKARGGFEVGFEWSEAKLQKAKVKSLLGGNCRIRSNIPLKVKEVEYVLADGDNPNPFYKLPKPPPFERSEKAGEAKMVNMDDKGFTIDFNTEKGKTYTLLPVEE